MCGASVSSGVHYGAESNQWGISALKPLLIKQTSSDVVKVDNQYDIFAATGLASLLDHNRSVNEILTIACFIDSMPTATQSLRLQVDMSASEERGVSMAPLHSTMKESAKRSLFESPRQMEAGVRRGGRGGESALSI